MNVIAIVQARMGSTRLPGKVLKDISGKVLKDISGKPMLWHVVNRLRFSKLINKIVVATSINKKDDAIEEFCKENNIDFYRGSEEDVLDRYYQASILYKADYVVRITADCPLIDPKVTDKVISVYVENCQHYVGASNTITRTFPRGLDTEVFSFSALEKLWKQAKKEYQREHVTIFMYENPGVFRVYSVEQKLNLSQLRWTVDEDKDLEFIQDIYEKLYEKEHIFVMEDVLKLLDKEPYLKEKNKDVQQKLISK